MHTGMDYYQLLTQQNLVSAQSTYPMDARHAGFTSLSAITKNWCWTTGMHDGKPTTTGLQNGKCGLYDAWF
jgi:hypothetical protein